MDWPTAVVICVIAMALCGWSPVRITYERQSVCGHACQARKDEE